MTPRKREDYKKLKDRGGKGKNELLKETDQRYVVRGTAWTRKLVKIKIDIVN